MSDEAWIPERIVSSLTETSLVIIAPVSEARNLEAHMDQHHADHPPLPSNFKMIAEGVIRTEAANFFRLERPPLELVNLRAPSGSSALEAGWKSDSLTGYCWYTRPLMAVRFTYRTPAS